MCCRLTSSSRADRCHRTGEDWQYRKVDALFLHGGDCYAKLLQDVQAEYAEAAEGGVQSHSMTRDNL